MGRTIVFGDVHGCFEEWEDLLSKLAVAQSDRLISVGDLICKGPASAQALDLAISIPNLECVVGNHELRFLKCWKAGKTPDIKPYDRDVVLEMGARFEDYMTYINSWPYYLNLPEILVIHAGLRPGVPLEKQTKEDLTELRTVGLEERPWYDFYEGEKPVAFGHWVRREPFIADRLIGLDTGCVYGGRLSAYILPDRRVVSVPARKEYAFKRSWKNGV